MRGTGKPWNPAVQAWADASLKRFAYEWHRYFRGELPVKDDTDVTDEDIRRCNLILFGDPGSNTLDRPGAAEAAAPLDARRSCGSASSTYAAADHAPVLIQPNPLRGGPLRRPQQRPHLPREGAGLAQLPAVPATGDWAVIKVGGKPRGGPSGITQDEVIRTGFFDEQWGLPEKR